MMKKSILIFSLLCSGLSYAEYHIEFINNTNRAVKAHSSFNAGASSQAISTSAYKGYDNDISPYGYAPLFDINYNEGIKNGQTYCFVSTLTDLSHQKAFNHIDFNLCVRGDWVGSSVMSSDSEVHTDDGRSKITLFDRKPTPGSFPYNTQLISKKEIFTHDGQAFNLYVGIVHHGASVQSTDDIFFVLDAPQQSLASEVNEEANVLNVLTYNVQLNPFYFAVGNTRMNMASERATIIPTKIQHYDVVVAEELFDKAHREHFIAGMSKSYPYHYGPVYPSEVDPRLTSGVVIFSRWPIVQNDALIYSDCTGSDCGAHKAIQWVKINKKGKLYNIFGTHTQAWNDEKAIAARDRQFQQIYSFIQSRNIPNTEPVLLAGDLNINWWEKDKVQYNRNIMPHVLQAAHWINQALVPYSSDFIKNKMNTDDSREMLDYILAIKDYEQPITQTSQILVLRAPDENAMYDGGLKVPYAPYGMLDLSDHFALESQLVY
ncbi:sphingomyelin phosphodiesterase [Cysteiniphilum sp. JM-1]|uniref:sphingomyelin phosphodiesterase n=1 Tax=Cysteiniphilum sp. JM-1 TaxID=2610891 RepID=UPI001245F352|nr:sphingomyelin phosphodiesterase [Cysteiniphilum sp. JM-1]